MTRRAITLLLLCAVCALGTAERAGAGLHRHRGVGDAPSCTSSPSSVPGGPGHRPIAGWAFIGRGYELSDATVSLWTLGGRKIPGAATRTGPTGVFTLSPLARDLPTTFIVRVRGGSIAHRRQPHSFAFAAVVHRRELRRIVFVGLASTVLSDFLRGHPRTAERAALTRLHHVLGVPAWHNLGYDLYNISGNWYSAARVMQVADARGGMRRLVAALVRAMAHAGRGAQPPLPRSSDGAGAARGTFGHQGPRLAHAAQATWFLTQLASGVISAAAGRGAGWVFDQIGFSFTPSYVSDIEAQLSQLAAEISELQDEIAAVNAAVQESYFAQQSNNLTAARSALDTAMEDMAYLPGITNDTNRQYWAQTYFCQDIKPIATNQKPWGSTRVLIDEVLVDVPPGEKPLGEQGAIYIKSQDPYWSSTDSQNVWEIVDFWTQYAVEAADVYLEYQHTVGAEQYCDNPPSDAGCPLQKEVDLTAKLGQDALATLTDSHGTPLKPMPDGYTVDMRTGLMWCMFCWPAANIIPLSTPGGEGVLAGLPRGLYDGLPVLAFNNFTLATTAQIKAMMTGCGCDPSHPTGVQWLVDKAALAPSWLNAPDPSPGLHGVYTMGADNIYQVFDLRTLDNLVSFEYSGTAVYYLLVRVPSASEFPFYP
jgi:hypothetical protein